MLTLRSDPWTRTAPSTISRSTSAASSMWAATRISLRLIWLEAPAMAPAIITVYRLPPGPVPFSPWSVSE